MTDDEVAENRTFDDWVASVVAVDMPPTLPASIRARVIAEHARRRKMWGPLLAAAALGALVVRLMIVSQPETAFPAPLVAREFGGIGTLMVAETRFVRAHGGASTPTPLTARRPVETAAPIIVDPHEAEVFRWFVEGAFRAPVALASVDDMPSRIAEAIQARFDAVAFQAITVPPINVSPLPGDSEGDAQ